jgi:hypothetical protein
MKLNYQYFQKLLSSSVSFFVITAIAIPLYPVGSIRAEATRIVTQNQGSYKSDRLGIRFNYSAQDFVVQEKTSSRKSDNQVEVIDIWTQEHARKIQSGAYERGTEYPANVHLAVYKNPQKLPLRTWIQRSMYFPASKQFNNVKIAGQNAVKFTASGLYENQHIAVVHPNNGNIVVVTLSQIGSGDNDAKYRKVYGQVVQSLSFR